MGRMLCVLLAGCLLSGFLGCHAVDLYSSPLQSPAPSEMEPPRELSMVSLPTYRIEPPDFLHIEALKLVPRPPYRIEIYDVLQIRVLGTILDQPIDDLYIVEGEGIVSLGPAYGSVYVAGLTLAEATAEVTRHLKKILQQPEVSIQLVRAAGTQQITDIYLVGSDGTVNLRQYGFVHVAGKTVEEARVAIQQQLALYFDSPEISVDVVGYNSKSFYVILAGAENGENIQRLSITGNETVLDAISQIHGLSAVSGKTIWVSRPRPGSLAGEEILPVDWAAVTKGGVTSTNYQLLPGDRVYIVDDKLIAADNLMAQWLRPVERLLGITALGTRAVYGTQVLGRNYNRERRM